MTDIAEIAAQAEAALKQTMKIEPIAVKTIGMFVPGAAPVVALVQPIVLLLIPYIERALEDIAAGNEGDLLNAALELIQHLTKGQPDAVALSPSPRPDQV